MDSALQIVYLPGAPEFTFFEAVEWGLHLGPSFAPAFAPESGQASALSPGVLSHSREVCFGFVPVLQVDTVGTLWIIQLLVRNWMSTLLFQISSSNISCPILSNHSLVSKPYLIQDLHHSVAEPKYRLLCTWAIFCCRSARRWESKYLRIRRKLQVQAIMR